VNNVSLGSGLVGKSWAMLFASGGHQVRLYDSDPAALKLAVAEVHSKLKSLEESGDLKNSSQFSAEKQGRLIMGNENTFRLTS